MNASQKAEFSTKFPTLDKDFSELRKFQSKPLKPRCNTGLKTPNPEGFWITPRSRRDRLVRLKTSRGVQCKESIDSTNGIQAPDRKNEN